MSSPQSTLTRSRAATQSSCVVPELIDDTGGRGTGRTVPRPEESSDDSILNVKNLLVKTSTLVDPQPCLMKCLRGNTQKTARSTIQSSPL